MLLYDIKVSVRKHITFFILKNALFNIVSFLILNAARIDN